MYKKYRPGHGQVDIFYVDKKFMQIYVDIKIYRPGRDVYVKFMFLHKRVYYMYTRLCEFWQAPIKVGSHDENLRISLVQNFVPGYGLFYGKKAPPNNQRFC